MYRILGGKPYICGDNYCNRHRHVWTAIPMPISFCGANIRTKSKKWYKNGINLTLFKIKSV